MKKIYSFLALTLMLVSQLMMGSAQNSINTLVIPKTSSFPSTGLSYLDDPTKYFRVTLNNFSGTSQDIYLGITVSCEFSSSSSSFSFNTKPTVVPPYPLTIGNGQSVDLTNADYHALLSNVQYEMNGIDWQEALTLPEGNYRICVTPYKWVPGGVNPTPIQAGEPGCCFFSICYSGSAPEFITPVVGQSAANLNNPAPQSNPSEYFDYGSDNRMSNQYAQIPLQQKLTFRWTGVISNCLRPNQFRYVLKLVEVNVANGQTLQEAININQTVATIDAGSALFYTIDTIRDRQFRLIPGHVYAAEVTAVLKDEYSTSLVALGNEGKSQIIAFVWGEGNTISGSADNNSDNSNLSSSTKNNKDDVLKTIRNHYIATPFQDKKALKILTDKFGDEGSHAPKPNTYVTHDVDGETIYTIPKKGTLFTASWMPMRSDSIESLTYTAYLYKYIGGNIQNSLAFAPIHSINILENNPDAFAADNYNLVSIEYPGWEETMEEGEKYLFLVDATARFRYASITTYTKTEYIDAIPTYVDVNDTNILYDYATFSSYALLQWGIDSGALKPVTVAEFTYPSKLTSHDSTWTEIQEVLKDDDFEFLWNPASGVSAMDTAKYDFVLCKLKNRSTIAKAIKDTMYHKDNLTETHIMNDAIRDSLKVGETYVAFLKTKVVGHDYDYLIPNKGLSKYIVFKMISNDSVLARLTPTIQCNPDHLKDIDKTPIVFKTDSLIRNKVRLKMGEMPLVIQKVKEAKDNGKKLTGEGYVVWKPFGVECFIKVQFDSIQVNKNGDILDGTAKSIGTDNTNYVNMDFGYGWTDWTDDKINWLASKYGNEEHVKGYYDEINRYSNVAHGLMGVFDGESASVGVVTLPLALDDGVVSGSKNVKVTIGEMFFAPTTALMNMTAIFFANSDKMYVPFVATNICMEPQSLLGNIDEGIDLYLAKNYDVGLSDGYIMRFKAADTLGKPKNGCYLSFDTSGFKMLAADIEIEFNKDDLYKADLKNNGTVLKGQPVKARFYTKIYDWDDWTAEITMDAFALPGCEDYTFIPTGKGIVLDHSATKTPEIVRLPAEYVKDTGGKGGKGDKDGQGGKDGQSSQGGSGGSGSGSSAGAPQQGSGGSGQGSSGSGQAGQGGKDGKDGKGGKGGKKGTPPPPSWQGFYLEQFTVLFPDNVSNTFSDINGDKGKKKDSMLIYSYGINNSLKDSSYYYYPGSRIKAGAQNFIIDSAGISTTLYVSDLLTLETDKGGGWALSVDTVAINITKGELKEGRIVGQVGMPLFAGRLAYKLALGKKVLEFNLHPKDTNFKLDLWLANIALDPASSYFKIRSVDTIKNTLIDMAMNGTINIDFGKIGLPVEFAAIKFEKMSLRNYTRDTTTTAFKFDSLEFDIGKWSKASPQKRLFSYHDQVNEVTEVAQVQDGKKPMFEGSVGGFSFSVETLSPIFESAGGNKKKVGLTVAGGIKIGVGACSDGSIGAGAGFKFWGVVDTKTWDFNTKDIDGELDSIWVETDLDLFKLKGKIGFFRNDATYGEGLRGNLMVTIMDKVTFGAGAGFGTVKKPGSEDETFDWWYVEGVAKCNPGIPLGAVNLTGLGGGFAYNMAPKNTGLNTDPRELRKAGEKGLEGNMVSSGMEFIPQYDAWAAKAGVAIALADPKTMNADGFISLRVANGHFSGFMLQVNASVITNYNKDDDTNSNTTLNVSAMINIVNTPDVFLFDFSAEAKSEINLTSLLKDAMASAVPLEITFPDQGSLSEDNMDAIRAVYPEIAKAEEEANKNPKQSDKDKDKDKGDEEGGKVSTPSGGLTIKIPLGLHVKHLKNGRVSEHTNSEDEWCFYIGRPPYDERVTFSMNADMVVCSAKAEFTFYFAIGNYFEGGFELPDIPKEVKDFLGADKVDKAKSKRISKMPDAGGFAMGASFNAKVEFDMFLWVNINAWLGFDVALMNTNGASCEGYPEIGKNNFYAIGQIYAMLEGKVGLSLNLGFWKGHLSLLEAGVGALLQGGGPQPTWCYGLLRFKADCLGGLIKINTSVDFELGDVCVPGAGDPLANVKLFESISPSFEDPKTAVQEDNITSPFSNTIITSNMPWDEELILATPDPKDPEKLSDARKFKFVLWEPSMSMAVDYSRSQNPKNWSGKPKDAMKFKRSNNNSNVYYFETSEGGLYESTTHKIHLVARALEERKYCANCVVIDTTVSGERIRTDQPYNLSTKTVKTNFNKNDLDWYNPTFYISKNRTEVKPFMPDTTIYITTSAAPDNLTDQVLFTWPYNGDPYVPKGEIKNNTCHIYMKKDREKLFNPSELAKDGKMLKVFVVRQGEDIAEPIDSNNIHYYGPNWRVTRSHLEIKLPESFNQDPASTLYKIVIYTMDKDQYNTKVNEQILLQQQSTVIQTHEVQGRDLWQIMEGNVTQTNTTTTTTTSSSQNYGTGLWNITPVNSEGSSDNAIPIRGRVSAGTIAAQSSNSSGSGSNSTATTGGRRPAQAVAQNNSGSGSSGSNTSTAILAGSSSSSSSSSGRIASGQNTSRQLATLRRGRSQSGGHIQMEAASGTSNRPVNVQITGAASLRGIQAGHNGPVTTVMSVTTQPQSLPSQPVGENHATIIKRGGPAGGNMNIAHLNVNPASMNTSHVSITGLDNLSINVPNLNMTNPTMTMIPGNIDIVNPGIGGGTGDLLGGVHTVVPGSIHGNGTNINPGTGTIGGNSGGIGSGIGTAIPGNGTNINPGTGTLGGYGSTGGGLNINRPGGVSISRPGIGGLGDRTFIDNGSIESHLIEVSISRDIRGGIQNDRHFSFDPDYGRHGSGSGGTSNFVDVRQIRIDEARDEMLEKGQDTMMDYTRTKINEYAIATQIGNVVYILYFGTSEATINTYEDLFTIIKNNVTEASWKNKSWTHTKVGTSVKTTLPAVNDNNAARIFYKYAYLFNSYKPNDRTMYRDGITLPPIATFVVNTDNTIESNNLFKLHKAYRNRLDDFYHVSSSFKLYGYDSAFDSGELNRKINYIPGPIDPENKPSSNVNDLKGPRGIPHQDGTSWKGWEKINSEINVSHQNYQWSRSGNNVLPELNYRTHPIKWSLNSGMYSGTGNMYTNVQEGTSSFNSWWNTPNILDITVTAKTNCRIDSSYFTNTSKRLPTYGDNPEVSIVDKITSPIFEDLKIFNSFFQQIYNYAVALDCRGYRGDGKKKETLLHDIANPNNVLMFDDFPFQIPSFIRSTFYFYTWDFTYDPNYYYNTYLSVGRDYSHYKDNTWYDMEYMNEVSGGYRYTEDYKFLNVHRYWYDYWMFCEKFYTGHAKQGLVRFEDGDAGKTKENKVKAHPFFAGLVPITTSTNAEQPVYLDIYYISPEGGFETFCDYIVSDINEIETEGRTFKYTKIYPLNWKFNLFKITNDQRNNLIKYNKLVFSK